MHRVAVATLRHGRDHDSFFQSPPEDLCCPVCQKPLSLPPLIKPNGLIDGCGKKAGNLKDWKLMQSGKSKEGEIVIAAMCGHIFHKFCLRHYCFVYRSGNTESDRVECPTCFQYISMTKVHMIDYNAHIGIRSDFEKGFKNKAAMNQELTEQKADGLKKLLEIEQLVEEAKQKLQTYRGHEDQYGKRSGKIHKQIALKEEMHGMLKECNQAIDRMHKENVHLIKMYLSHLRAHPNHVLKDKRIPPVLVPYLAIIQGDERLMRKFGEILKPIEINGLRSNTEMLIQEILADAKPKAKEEEERRSKHIANLPKHFHLKQDEANPVVVKVQRSSVSIFSKAALDEKSLQQIMQQVKDPIKSLKEAHEKVRTKNTEPKSVKKSISDIQILFEHKKRQTESTPNRQLEVEEIHGKESNNARKCKSTNPVLITNCKVPKPKVLIVKLEDLKPAKDKGDHASHIKTKKPTMDKTGISIDEEIESQYGNQSTLETNLPHENNKGPKEPIRAQENDIKGHKSNHKLDIVPKGSVLEVLFENLQGSEKSDTSFVDEISRLVVKKQLSPLNAYGEDKPIHHNGIDDKSMEVIEYKIEDKKTNGGDFQWNNVDIESENKLSEVIVNSNSTADAIGYGTNSVLKGILPGPYIKSPRSLKPSDHPSGPGTVQKQLPIYLSKWMKKLPSARKGVADGLTVGQQRLPPPPCSLIQRNACMALLPPLPETPLTPTQVKTSRKTPPIDINFIYGTRNRPYGDEISDTNASYKQYNDNGSLRNIVIEIPKSQATLPKLSSTGVIHRPIRLKSHNSNLWISGVMEHPCSCCPNNESLFQNRLSNRSKPHLPPLPDESIQQRQINRNANTIAEPTSIRRSRRVLAQPVGVSILVQPTFSNMNALRPMSSRYKESAIHPRNKPLSRGHHYFEPHQGQLSPLMSQDKHYPLSSPSFRRDVFSTQAHDRIQYSLNQFDNFNRKRGNEISGISDAGNQFSKRTIADIYNLASSSVGQTSFFPKETQHFNPTFKPKLPSSIMRMSDMNTPDTQRFHSGSGIQVDENNSSMSGLGRILKRAKRRQAMHV